MALVLERVEALLGDTQKVRLVDLQMVRLNDCTVERFGEQLPAHLFFEWRMVRANETAFAGDGLDERPCPICNSTETAYSDCHMTV